MKSDRQVINKPKSSTSQVRTTHETHTSRSKNNLKHTNAATIGISHHRVNKITTQIINTVLNIMSKYNVVHILPGVVKSIPVRAASDNVVIKVDTPDGRDSFHGTANSVYQHMSSGIVYGTVCEPLTLTNKSVD